MEKRKKDHIDLAFNSQMQLSEHDNRFYYEPLMSGHNIEPIRPLEFLGRTLKVPLWISSITGGTQLASKINRNLATVCREYGMGMGLGSCRSILDDNKYFDDFNMRPYIGNELPLYANLGISQLEQLMENGKEGKMAELINRLQADGLIIHVNPMQEWLQPEGDRIAYAPIDSVRRLLDKVKFKVIVKEVGQGMGPESLLELLKLPLAAIEFGAFGGTNFAKLELLRAPETEWQLYEPLSRTGHTAAEMVEMVNQIVESGLSLECNNVIVSGGIKSFLDGYYLIRKIKIPAVYGQASSMLKYAKESYEELHRFVDYQVKGLRLAFSYLKVR